MASRDPAAAFAPRYCYPQCADPWFNECADCWVDGGNPALYDAATGKEARQRANAPGRDTEGRTSMPDKRTELEAAVQRAETALSDANEGGSRAAIQRAETRLSNAVERLERNNRKCQTCGGVLVRTTGGRLICGGYCPN